MAEKCEALVIGAGVVGMATAYALARRGLSVTVVDRGAEPARGTSFANGAQLSYAYTEPLAAPALLPILPLLVLGRDSAFRFRPSLDPDFIRWALAFLRNCTPARFSRNMLAGLKHGLESRAAMHALLDRHPIDFGHVKAGKLHLLEGEAAVEAASSLVEIKRSAGIEQRLLTPDEAADLEPSLRGRASRLSAAVHSPEEEVGDPYLFSVGLAEILRREYGVRTRFGTSVERLERNGRAGTVETSTGERIEAKQVAICTGVDTPALLRGSGIKAPIWPMKGYSLTAPPGAQPPRLSITDAARRLVFCRLSGEIRVAGLAELGNRDTSIDPRRLDTLVRAARSSMPEAADYGSIRSRWTGLRPMSPSSLPIIRRGGGSVVLNVGHGALGWTFAMGAAERAADLVLEGVSR